MRKWTSYPATFTKFHPYMRGYKKRITNLKAKMTLGLKIKTQASRGSRHISLHIRCLPIQYRGFPISNFEYWTHWTYSKRQLTWCKMPIPETPYTVHEDFVDGCLHTFPQKAWCSLAFYCYQGKLNFSLLGDSLKQCMLNVTRCVPIWDVQTPTK